MSETVNHPAHYGGADNPYEAIKVIEAWGLGFHLGNSVKYIARAGKKGDDYIQQELGGKHTLEDLQKAQWCLQRRIERLGGAPEEKRNISGAIELLRVAASELVMAAEHAESTGDAYVAENKRKVALRIHRFFKELGDA